MFYFLWSDKWNGSVTDELQALSGKATSITVLHSRTFILEISERNETFAFECCGPKQKTMYGILLGWFVFMTLR